MNTKDTGGPAFPVTPTDRSGQIAETATGLTVRDYFAAKAAHQFLADAVIPPGFDVSEQFRYVSVRAYEMADAMLSARNT